MVFERSLRPEFSEREQRLIARLRGEGPEDPEAREMLLLWQTAAEENARKPEGNRSRAEIEVQLRLARIYRAAGGYDSAMDALEAVKWAASCDPSAADLEKQAEAMMDEIDAERGSS